MKRSGFTLIELLVVIAVIAVLAAYLFPGSRNHGDNPRDEICSSNLKRIAIGFLQYTQDYDGKFPRVTNRRSGNWAGSLQPYVKSWDVFQCPRAKGHTPKTTDYFFNWYLGGAVQKNLGLPQSIILAGDGRDDAPTNFALREMPDAWIQDGKSPAYRHYEKGIYVFGDGHVHRYSPRDISNDAPTGKNQTFQMR